VTADVAPLPGLAARIRVDAAKVMDDRAATLRWLAESVIDGHPGLATTHLDMARPLCDEGLSDDDVAQVFGELCEYVRTAQIINSHQSGDSTRADWLVDAKVDLLLGTDRYVGCAWCDRREDRELAETCDGHFFCSTACHASFDPVECPEGKL
jgi:hypothetical protein